MGSQRYRAVTIALAGIIVTSVAIGVSQAASGLAAAIALMTAAVTLPVAIGIAISQMWHRDKGSGLVEARPGFSRRFRDPSVADLTRCTGCGSHRQLSKTVLVCPRCDLSPAVY